MKKLAKLSPGRIFNFAGEKFVVMEQRDGAAFVLLAQSKESCPFNDKDDAENRNDYTRSTLKERIDKWVEALPRTSEEAAAILPFEVDLSCTDRSKSYGTITVKAAPLTLWQYGQFKELIPLNEDDWYWLRHALGVSVAPLPVHRRHRLRVERPLRRQLRRLLRIQLVRHPPRFAS